MNVEEKLAQLGALIDIDHQSFKSSSSLLLNILNPNVLESTYGCILSILSGFFLKLLENVPSLFSLKPIGTSCVVGSTMPSNFG